MRKHQYKNMEEHRELLTTEMLADRWSVSTTTLERWRQLGLGPAYIKLMANTGRVLYRIEDIVKYETKNLVMASQTDKGLSTKMLR